MNVLLLDSQPLFIDALEALVKSIFPNANIYKEDCSARASMIIRSTKIDAVILDTELKNGSGIDYAKRLRSADFIGGILFISSNSSKMYSQIARVIRANGLVYKTQSIQVLRGAITLILQGNESFDRCECKRSNNLSVREELVLSYLSKGYSNKEISKILSLSNKTISTYKSRILSKYNAKSIIEIISCQNSSS